MMAALADFHFLRPLALLGLLLLPLMLRWLARPGQADPAWRAACDAHLLPHLVVSAGRRTRAPLWLALSLWSVACLALAGPAWERSAVPLYRSASARVIVLALTTTMLSTDLKPSRLERARFKIADLLRDNDDSEVALVAYAGDAFVVAPLTDDVNTVSHLLEALDPTIMPVAGANPDRALALAGTLLGRAGHVGGDVLLVADAADRRAVQAATDLRARGIAVSVLAVGTAQGAPVVLPGGGFMKDASGNILLPKLDAATLRDVASAGGGNYAAIAVDGSDLAKATAGFGAGNAAQRAEQALSERFQDRGPWLLLLLVPLALACFRRGWLMLLPLALLLNTPQSAQAMGWEDLWQRRDQQAAERLRQGDAEGALQVAEDPSWQGAAAYRKGDFERAAEAYQDQADAEAHYNLGNALAKQGRYEEALAAYSRALERQADLVDAQANKKAVEDWLKQQQQQQQQQQQGQGQQDPNQQPQEQSQQQEGEQHSADQQQAEDSQQDAQSSQQQQAQQNAQQAQDQQGQQGAQQQQDSSDQEGQSASQEEAQAQEQQAQQEKDSVASDAEQQQSDPSAADQPEQDSQEKLADAAQKGDAAAKERQAAEEFSRRMGQALAEQRDTEETPDKSAAKATVAVEAPPSEEEQAVEQWLQRVPDDPGGLLRRKFQLEHQRRQQAGGEEDQP